MILNKLSIKDEKKFDKFLNLTEHELAVYAFGNIYICRALYDIYYAVIKNSLCVFFKDNLGCFMNLAPLAEKISPEAIKASFDIMDKFNPNKKLSRIENIEQKDARFYENLGYRLRQKCGDYLCKRTDLEQLKGNRFKSKRSGFNYFVKNYQFEYLRFSVRDKDACLKLYKQWKGNRKSINPDRVYQGMLQDSQKCLGILLHAYPKAGFEGRIVKIKKKIRAFSFGFELSRQTFCILYEITDLSIKGLSQFIFRQFCSELKKYKYINIMDDSGLKNLKKVKLSYYPLRMIPSYIAERN